MVVHILFIFIFFEEGEGWGQFKRSSFSISQAALQYFLFYSNRVIFIVRANGIKIGD